MGKQKKKKGSGDAITYYCMVSNSCLWALELAVLFDRQHQENASVGKYLNLSLVLLIFIMEHLSGIDDDSVLLGVWWGEKKFLNFMLITV